MSSKGCRDCGRCCGWRSFGGRIGDDRHFAERQRLDDGSIGWVRRRRPGSSIAWGLCALCWRRLDCHRRVARRRVDRRRVSRRKFGRPRHDGIGDGHFGGIGHRRGRRCIGRRRIEWLGRRQRLSGGWGRLDEHGWELSRLIGICVRDAGGSGSKPEGQYRCDSDQPENADCHDRHIVSQQLCFHQACRRALADRQVAAVDGHRSGAATSAARRRRRRSADSARRSPSSGSQERPGPRACPRRRR